MGRTSELSLGEDERIILYQQGAYLSRRSWKLGHLYLTNKRLLFRQVKRLILDVPLENITAVGFHKKPFILATKTCMLLSYHNGSGGQRREATIITAHLDSWCAKIAELLSERGMELEVRGVLTEDDIAQARRDRVREILDEIHAGERRVPTRSRLDRAQEHEDVEKRRDIAQPHRDHINLRQLLAEIEAEEGAEAGGGEVRKGDLAQARRDRAQGKIPLGEGEEIIKTLRLDRARDEVLASIRGEASIRDLEGATPRWVSDIAQARRDRVKEIVAEAHGEFPERIEEEHIAEVAQALDPASREMIWYLRENRHAKIEELRQLLGESCHMSVLTRINEVINPTARKMLGVPLLVFESRRADPWTGEVVPFSWWLCREAERRPRIAPPADVFDEGEQVVVVMELAGVEEKDIQVRAEGEWLIVTAGDRPPWEIALPATVDGKRITTHYHNNVLQVRLEKRTSS
ncbi:MAG: hypothetical protein L6435_15250 [Anaerolineae bacterium]|nr:hypothetical protein [Anaerolineae bacterium]